MLPLFYLCPLLAILALTTSSHLSFSSPTSNPQTKRPRSLVSSFQASSMQNPHSDFSSATPSSGALKCKTLGSSLDKWILPDDDGFVNDDLRVGGPYLCAPPAFALPLPKSSSELVRLGASTQSLLKAVRSILEQFGVQLELLPCPGD